LPANTKASNVPPGPSLKGGRKSSRKSRKTRKTRKHRK
jgi:hypothetical protein